jgi:prepilin-type processing-associated H-X9-DG protein
MSILMPALQRVKKQAATVRCLAGTKQWGLIFSMYADENDGKFPRGQGSQGFWWIADLPEKDQSRIQNPLWFCPSAKEPIIDEYGNAIDSFNIFNAWGIYTRSNYSGLCADGISGSYGLNGYVLSTPPGGNFEGGRLTENNWRTPRVQGAALVPLFVESLRFDFWPLETDPPAEYEYEGWSGTNHMARCCINRHDGFINVLFCDFGARKVGLKELWTLKWHKNFNTAGMYTKAGGMNPSDWPEWIRKFPDY